MVEESFIGVIGMGKLFVWCFLLFGVEFREWYLNEEYILY